jgi:cytochrome c2
MKSISLGAVLAWLLSWTAAAADPGTTFLRKCSACHTVGHGRLVGPDLKGVTDRRTRVWLAKWIASPEKLITSGDATAVALSEQFKPLRMPDMGLSAGDISAVIEYLAAGGPEGEARRKRRTETATSVEIEIGRVLFAGQRAFTSGVAACFSCHRIGTTFRAGGTLGPDLASAYARYQDKALSALLVHGCFPGASPTAGKPALTDDELFALKAFMRGETRAAR